MAFRGKSDFAFILLLCSCAVPQSQNIVPAAEVTTDNVERRTTLDAIARDYVQLTLELGEQEAGYVDAYYGPPNWAVAAKTKPRDMRELGNDIVDLMLRLDALPKSEDALVEGRKRFLSAQLEAALTRHAMMQGEIFAFAKEAKGLFGVTPEFQPLASYDAALAKIEALVPGSGPLHERVEAYQERFTIPTGRLKTVFDAAIAECKRRTAEHIALPADENFKMEFVTGKSWSGYNYYQGNYQSLIQINTDLPIRISRAVDLGCHEGYPGHHVYNMLLEQRLTRERGWPEFSVYPLYSPQSLIAEGSANYGIDLAFPGEERLTFERDVLYPLAGLDPAAAADYFELQQALSDLKGARFVIAQAYLDKTISRDDALELIQKYQLVSRERAEQSLSFNDQYRSYVINYGLGQDMVKAWIEQQGDAPVWRWKAMEKLLSEPMLPEDLAH
ncbi:hypothetical protein GCM10009096_21020 [Parasphingorhabdus litoris]|uniref:DUF885 domain-containing protein n=1 Tax=Parasphingorhabdus litoris TaxID=394733 RepID=A0ABP3KFZ3_9SPHN|nr:hypothetical protein [Parasphingorhabdus litoris]